MSGTELQALPVLTLFLVSCVCLRRLTRRIAAEDERKREVFEVCMRALLASAAE